MYRLLLLSALALIGLSPAAEAAPILDALTAPQVLTALPSVPASGTVTDPSIIGMTRFASLKTTSTAATSNTQLVIAGGQATVTLTAAGQPTNGSVDLIYSANGTGLNFLVPSNSALVLDFIGVDVNPGTFDATVVLNDGTNTDSATLPILATTTSLSFGLNNSIFPNINFSNPLFSIGLSFAASIPQTNANEAITFTITGGDGIVIQQGNPIPEPMTLATFGALALVGGYTARRKLKAAAVGAA